MFSLKKYWQVLREIEKSLPDYVYLYSQGGLVEVGAAVAARLLQAGSHRLATPEEIQQHRDQQRAAGADQVGLGDTGNRYGKEKSWAKDFWDGRFCIPSWLCSYWSGRRVDPRHSSQKRPPAGGT